MTSQNDAQILEQIGRFVDEEHALYRQGAEHGLDEAGHARLGQLKVALDQAWDLLDQRRALRDAGRNPNEAHLRSPAVVEKYQQ